MSERALQAAVFDFLRVALPSDAVCFCIPNGDGRMTTAPGTLPGVPDIAIIYRGRPIFIELKTAKGAVRANTERENMTDDQIKHMVDRFLMWKLPADFVPDCGISFERTAMGFTGEFVREPIGTNLLTAEQAREMVRHMIEGLVVVPLEAPTPAMAKAWAVVTAPSRAGIVCRCGLVLKTPSEYAAHCKESPDHFVTVTVPDAV